MKNAIILLLFLLFTSGINAQSDEGKRTNYQFKQRVAFYTVDNRYNLKTDTIYHSFNGFHVWSDYDTVEINNVVYMIFRYYDFSSKFKNDTTFRLKPERWNSRLYGSKKAGTLSGNDSIRGVKYSRYTDSMALVSKASMGKNPVHTDIYGKNGLLLAFPRDQFDLLKLNGKIIDRYSLKFKNAISMTSGWLTVPFKFRPKRDTVNFNMTTDITLGAYIGPRLRIARYSNNYIVVPVTLGLSYINVGNSETSNVNTSGNSSVIPGITWSSGVIFDLNGFNIGFVGGQDFASGVGKGWIYNNKCWFSFSIGHSFLSKSTK